MSNEAEKERDDWITKLVKQQTLNGAIKPTKKPVEYMRGKPVLVCDKQLREWLAWAWAGGAIQRNEHFKRASEKWP